MVQDDIRYPRSLALARELSLKQRGAVALLLATGGGTVEELLPLARTTENALGNVLGSLVVLGVAGSETVRRGPNRSRVRRYSLRADLVRGAS